MAQDFYAAFKVGEDDRHITSIDEDGVALAAIKALHHENAGLHAENAALRERLARDEARRTRDEARHVRELAALEGQIRALAENAHLAIYRKASR
jgi:regulator of replication initiation timing